MELENERKKQRTCADEGLDKRIDQDFVMSSEEGKEAVGFEKKGSEEVVPKQPSKGE